ncbi:hypothetical protein XA68_17575 [Ophiocordyceps unilateralis]|uniref:ribonuclease H n=1 Tax=Ophiocordyceps unilateralis TaxID=268505 RepID=A0A2A9P300_OPHUN|nr:hypothetical protein XA68_17575 [Ophiocordyceps unilateralis]
MAVQAVAKAFVPPHADSTVNDLFHTVELRSDSPFVAPSFSRLVRKCAVDGRRQFLIYTDGACLDDGQPNAQAGWAFDFMADQEPNGIISGRLERYGPVVGHAYRQTSNRAELRAVLAAMRFRRWEYEAFVSLVIATSSEYVTRGATEWLHHWIRNDWTMSNGEPVENQDLWFAILQAIHRAHTAGLEIQFWTIPRSQNPMADGAARRAAHFVDVDHYHDVDYCAWAYEKSDGLIQLEE